MVTFPQKFGSSLLLVILAFAYLTRMYNLHVPTGYIFDEVYHAVTAKLIAHNDPRAFEWWNAPPEPDTAVDWLHPPLAKYTQALSILAFGENSFGWRFSSVIFGTLTILMVYHLAQILFKNQKLSLLAAGLASLDGLLLVQSRIAMNDIHLTFFILLTMFVYAKFRESGKRIFFVLTGLCVGLAVATKWSGVFILASLLVFEAFRLSSMLVTSRGKIITKKYSSLQLFFDSLRWIIVITILPVVVYIASYGMMFAQGKDWQHFIELHQQIWHYQTHLEATHPYQSKPWQWILNLRPVWYYVSYDDAKRADIYAFGNSVIFIAGLVAAVLSAQQIIIKKWLAISKGRYAQMLQTLTTSPSVLLLVPYLLLWVPWMFSPRIMFFYHYTPAVPFLCILLAFWLQKAANYSSLGRYLAWSVIALAFLHFVIWYPHLVAIPLSNEFKNAVYFHFENWK